MWIDHKQKYSTGVCLHRFCRSHRPLNQPSSDVLLIWKVGGILRQKAFLLSSTIAWRFSTSLSGVFSMVIMMSPMLSGQVCNPDISWLVSSVFVVRPVWRTTKGFALDQFRTCSARRNTQEVALRFCNEIAPSYRRVNFVHGAIFMFTTWLRLFTTVLGFRKSCPLGRRV